MSVAGKQMVVYGAPGEACLRRLGLSVSKKTGGAVARNRIRRRLSEAFAGADSVLPEAYDAVIVARKPIAEQNYQNMEAEMTRLLLDLVNKEQRAAAR
jgi:ribonuclease P protein component